MLDLALHAGDVLYGNVGANRRLLRSLLSGHRCVLGCSIPIAASAAIASASRPSCHAGQQRECSQR
jgi:hypothetical protein